MSKRRYLLLLLLAGLVLAGTLLFLKGQLPPEEMAARQKLDDMLGSNEDGVLPPGQMQPPLPHAFPPLPRPNPRSVFGFPLPMPDAGVEIQETANSYTLRIPLADPQDAETIKLNVTPHRIEVAGQTGSNENGISLSSSFMQSFSTSQEVQPNQIQRKTEKKGDKTEMVITIPKKNPGQSAPSPDQPSEQPEEQAQDKNSEPGLEDLGPLPEDLDPIPWPATEPKRI